MLPVGLCSIGTRQGVEAWEEGKTEQEFGFLLYSCSSRILNMDSDLAEEQDELGLVVEDSRWHTINWPEHPF